MNLDLIEAVKQPSLFDYDSLDSYTRAFAEELDAEYDQFIEQTLDGLGRLLLKAKAGFKHGEFEFWYHSKGIKKTTAWRAMQVAQGKDLKSSKVELLPESATDQPTELVEEVQVVGKFPTNEDKRDTVKKFFTDFPHLQALSNREIAKRCRVDHKTVAAIRKELFPEPKPVIESTPEQVKSEPEQPQEPEPEPYGPYVGGQDLRPHIVEPETEDDSDKNADTWAPNMVKIFVTGLDEVREKHDAHTMRVMGSSESPEWYTPQEIVRLSIACLGEIDLDPCSNSRETPNVPARNHYTKEDDGLSHRWEGRVYLNPPYGSEVPRWADKLVKSYGHGVTEAIALLPGRIDTNWFQPLYEQPQMLMCNVRGRLQYENSPYNAPFPNVIVYLGERVDEFIRHFKGLGPIMRRIDDGSEEKL